VSPAEKPIGSSVVKRPAFASICYGLRFIRRVDATAGLFSQGEHPRSFQLNLGFQGGQRKFHEWLAQRMKNKRLWFNDRKSVVGMSNISRRLQKTAKVKPLKLPKAMLGVVKTL